MGPVPPVGTTTSALFSPPECAGNGPGGIVFSEGCASLLPSGGCESRMVFGHISHVPLISRSTLTSNVSAPPPSLFDGLSSAIVIE